jgi:hypothetical protein
MYTLENGEIVSGVLMDSETYVYETLGHKDIEIVCNSQTQAVLILVSTTKKQFPDKSSFDYQSNEGHIEIPALGAPRTVYILIQKLSYSSS